MNKNIQIAIAVLAVLVLGYGFYHYQSNKTPDITTKAPETKNVAHKSDAVKSEVPKIDEAKIVKVSPPKQSDTSYTCLNGKSLTIKRDYVTFKDPELTLHDGDKTKTVTIASIPSKVDPTYESKDKTIRFINKGNYVLAEENGKVTYAECKQVQQ